jgi:hypothetical protein
MTTVKCKQCSDKQTIDLPVGKEVEPNPCPSCQPQFYPDGFPGLYAMRNGHKIWLIQPSGGNNAKRIR